jgi:hypothetical protein
MSNPHPLGKLIPSDFNPIDILLNEPNLRGKGVICSALYFQVLPTNLGDVYIGTQMLNKTTGVGIIAILRPPTTNHLPDIAWNIPGCPNPFLLDEYRVTVDSLGDGVRCSFLTW